MVLPAYLRPHRSLAFPFAAILFSLWGAAIEVANVSWVRPPAAVNFRLFFALAAVALVASYVGATVVVATLGLRTRSLPWWAQRLFRPSNGAIAAFAALSTILWTYSIAGVWFGSADLFPSELFVLGPLAWPVLVAYVAIYAIGNLFGSQSTPNEVWAILLGTGAVLSVVWLFYLSGWIADVVHELSAMGR